ncbi:MAG: hypothetical protein R3F31_26830 [Verrucomicrobiales bacterium]
MMVVLGSFYCIRVAQEFRLRYVNHMVLGKENLRGYRRTADFLVPTLFLTVAITAWFVSLAMAVKSPTGHAGAGHTCSELMLQGLAQSVASSRALGALAGGLAMIMIFFDLECFPESNPHGTQSWCLLPSDWKENPGPRSGRYRRDHRSLPDPRR